MSSKKLDFDNLMSLEDAEFVDRAFLILLGRTADSTGLEHYSEILRTENGKVKVLVDLFDSREARSRVQSEEMIHAVRQYKLSHFWEVPRLVRSFKSAFSRRAKISSAETDPSGARPISHEIPANNDIAQQLEIMQESLAHLLYQADSSRLKLAKSTLGDGQSIYLFNLSTSNHWRSHAVGIVRVERELAKHLRDYSNVEFVLWDKQSQTLKKLLDYQVDNILSPQWCDKSNGLSSFASSRLDDIRENREYIYISAGLDWDLAPINEVCEYLSRFDARNIFFCFDTVPVKFPEFLARDSLAQEFRQHLIDIGHGAEKVIAISDITKHDVERFWDVSQMETTLPEIVVAPLATYSGSSNLPYLNPADSALMRDVFRNGEYVLYVSSFESRKNHRLILNIWRELWAERGSRCPQFIYVGAQGWGCNDLINRIPRMPASIGGKLHWLQNVNDDLLAHLYHHCSFTVFPSLYEGWGLAATESLAFGKACVIANTSSLEQATQGLMPAYHPHDHLGWKKEIEKLLDDRHYRSSLERNIHDNFKASNWTEFGAAVCNQLVGM